jgi:crotonobetainyl-CoA:carnitine CoA-transferase CaiB-like acyl-CoA transferase/predicted TIM-barrel fold metal-dependent hydrolase
MRPLSGIRVIEVAQNVAGPYAGAILAQLGADVLKIERPRTGDDARAWPPFFAGTSAHFHAMNSGKKSIALDLKDPEAMRWLKEHIAGADVLVQNLRPGALEDLGLGAGAMLSAYPRLVYCSIWAFGSSGPLRDRPGYDLLIQAFAGLMSLTGEEGSPPTRVGMSILDFGAGMWAALGILAALFKRQQTGRGCVVDTSLLETALGFLTTHIAAFKIARELPEKHRSAGSGRVVVFQDFETKDGQLIVAAANDALFARLVANLGHPEWAADPLFSTNVARVANKATLIPKIQAVMQGCTTQDWIERFGRAGVPCAPIHSLPEALAAPQTLATGLIQSVPGVDIELVGIPLTFDHERPSIPGRAPTLGEHNNEVERRPRELIVSSSEPTETAMATNGNTIISADSHVFEPVNLWESRLDRKHRERGPRFVTDWQGKPGTWLVADGIAPHSIDSFAATGIPKQDLVRVKGVHHKDLRPGGYDPVARLKDQEIDGVSAEVLYPTYAMNLYAMQDAELQEASFHAYNEWLVEMCGQAPDRLVGLALISICDVGRAVKNLEHWTKRGLRGAVIPCVPPEGTEYSEPLYEPFWAAAEEMRVPISLHTVTTARKKNFRFTREKRGAARYPENPMDVMLTLGEIITSPLLDRHPRLRLVIAEADIGWIPWLLARLDRGQERYGGQNSIHLKLKPSEYFARNVCAAFIMDRVGVFTREFTGVDNLMWSSDYPHTDSTWPKSRESIDRDFVGVSENDRYKMTCTNAAKLYGFKIN